MKLPDAEPFVTPGWSLKQQALKVLEESAELVEAVKSDDEEHAIYEAMDVYQALCNLIAAEGWSSCDVDRGYAEVHMRNTSRGRYDAENGVSV